MVALFSTIWYNIPDLVYIMVERRVFMSYSSVKIDDNLHKAMKELAGDGKGAIIEEYRMAVSNHIAVKRQEQISRESGLLEEIFNRIDKLENHLAGMLGRTGMDVSMSLMGLIVLLEKLYKGEVSRASIQEQLRKEGAAYYTKKTQIK